MDTHPPLVGGHSLRGPHRPFDPGAVPDGFRPLRLVLQPGGLTIELDRPDLLVGRHSEADVRLALPDVSRRHCRIQYSSGQWRVVDLSSLNGVFVNGERMHESNLYDGDELRLGSFFFHVMVGGPTNRNPKADVIRRIAEALPNPERPRAA